MAKTEPCSWTALKEMSTQGRCCCNCRYMKHIVAHPWNKLPEHKGNISEIIGYGCNMPELDSTVFFETEHSLCEMHDWQKKINDK